MPVKLGGVVRHGNGFRVLAKINGAVKAGPCRTTMANGERDLRRAQMAQTREQYLDILRQLHQEVHAVNRGNFTTGAAKRYAGSRSRGNKAIH